MARDGKKAILRAFFSDYATSIFKNTILQQSWEIPEVQRRFLEEQFFVLGASGYTRIKEDYLLGLRTDHGPTDRLAGLIQYVPQGFVAVEENCRNAITQTLIRELQEETGLDLKRDCAEAEMTHILLGTLNGDFTIVHRLHLKPEAREKAKADAEELETLFYLPLPEIKRRLANPETKYSFSPVTASLFERLGDGAV